MVYPLLQGDPRGCALRFVDNILRAAFITKKAGHDRDLILTTTKVLYNQMDHPVYVRLMRRRSLRSFILSQTWKQITSIPMIPSIGIEEGLIHITSQYRFDSSI